MLNQVDGAAARPVAREVARSRTGPSTVWVTSKGQPPYEFCPCWDPCSPHEWPYNLQALRGTEDYEDIIAWYFQRHQDFSPSELTLLLRMLVRCLGEREVSVAIYNDIDTGDRHLWFTVWGFSADRMDEASEAMLAFQQLRLSTRALDNLLCKINFSPMPGRFADRHLLAARE